MAEDTTTPDDAPPLIFGTGDKLLAAVLLVGALALVYVCTDVIAGGRVTGMLAHAPTMEN